MTCPSCAHENPERAKFCLECGAALAARCPSCGIELPTTAKFCLECGASLRSSSLVPGRSSDTERAPSDERRAASPEQRATSYGESRKIVTILFADLAGSTALHERLDPESVRAFMARYYEAMRAAVEGHGGTVVKLLGDGVMAAFGVPTVAEDDAIRAVRAAVAMQEAFRAVAGEQSDIGLRVAVNTGEVVVSADDSDVVGDPVNVAARLQQEAGNGVVVIGEATQRLAGTQVTLEPLGRFALKGRAGTVRAYRVVSLERPTGAAAVPFVGREEEIGRIRAVYDEAAGKPAARLAVLLGSPGLGKSRLIDEITRRLGDAATVLSAHCDAAGGATFEPIAAALRKFLKSDVSDLSDQSDSSDIEAMLPGSEAERARIAKGISALLAGSPASPEETFFVVRRFLAALATKKPVVLVIDDIHWAEPLLLDLMEHLVQWGSGVPLLVLTGARPELRDVRSAFTTTGGAVSDVVTLSGLDAGAAMRLAANVVGAADLPAAIAGKVLATSEGNPLFVGELVRMLVQEGALTKEGDRWTVGEGLASLEMPPTIHALLAARIERLRPEERTVLERAAVVGRHFSRGAMAELLPREVDDLDARIESLKRTELIEPDTGWFLGEPQLRFHHALIRDAAYRRLLKGTRAELHARLADWIEAKVKESGEHDETIGRHLEQAHQLLRELGPVDTKGKELGERAAQRLAAAGRRALARDDVPVAADLLGRAIERLDTEDPTRADLALDWCEALLAVGDVSAASSAIEELARFAGSGLRLQGAGFGEDANAPRTPNPAPGEAANGRLRAWLTCFTGQLTVMTAPQELESTVNAVAEAADEFAKLEDAAGEAKAHFVQAQALARLGRVGACEAALDKALAAARKAGDRRRANAVLAGAPLAALWGPSPVTRASGRCLDVVRVLRITQGAPAVEAVALSCQGVLEALRGRTDAARRMIASSRTMVEELGIAHRLYEADVFAGRIDLLEGDAEASEGKLREAYDGLRELGLGIDAARAGSMLARALLAQGKVEEAERLTEESEALAGDDLQAAIAWRAVRAEALAQRGEHAGAIELAKAGVDIAAATDALLDHADARLALAAALRAAGRGREADAEERRAIELWEAKGASLLAERARSETKTAVSRPDAGEARSGTEPTVRRRIRPNAHTMWAVRYEAAFAARDVDKLISFHSEDFREIDHPTGATYGHAGAATSLHKLMKAENPWFRQETLATLGASLALGRRWYGAGGGGRLDVGPYEREEIALSEVDAQGCVRYVEVFAPDHLHQGVIRLYEFYAESLPAGAERDRAAATARVMRLVLRDTGRIDDLTGEVAPGFECVDHRPLSTWSQKGGEEFLEHVRALQEVAEDIAMPVVDVLALEPDTLLIRRMHSGTERVGGGSYERPHLGLWVTGADGRLVRYEIFDDDCEAEALARFEELVGSDRPPLPRPVLSNVEGGDYRGVDPQGGKPPPDPLLGKEGGPVRRRVQPNAASAAMEHLEATVRTRDLDAIGALHHEALELVDHQNGLTYGLEGVLQTFERMLRSPRVDFRFETLATLGQSLCLGHRLVTGRGTAGPRFDVGEYDMDNVILGEIGDDGRFRRFEVFDADYAGTGIRRLYERYAELLPAGVERDWATSVARTVATVTVQNGLADLDRWAKAFAPDVEVDDHRKVGVGVVRGRQAWIASMRALFELSTDVSYSLDDVLALRPDGFLVECTNRGKDRATGGTFERTFYFIALFGDDGPIVRWEQFDLDHRAEALARWDELVGSASLKRGEVQQRRVRPNAATTTIARFDAAFAIRDADALAALLADPCEEIDHPTGTSYGRDGALDGVHRLWKSQDPYLRHRPLATLGDSLALFRRWVGARGASSGRFDVAEREEITLSHVDERGRQCRCEVFNVDQLGSALVRLYEQYAETLPHGAERDRAIATAKALATFSFTMPDVDRWATALASDVQAWDHRRVGFGRLDGAQALKDAVAAMVDLTADSSFSTEDILAARPDGYLHVGKNVGVDRSSGGAFERYFWMVLVFGSDGRIQHWEQFEPEHRAEALARFDELTAAVGPARRVRRVRPNAATRHAERVNDAMVARDADALMALISSQLEVVHHPTGSTYGAAQLVDGFRPLFQAKSPTFDAEILATLGDSLALVRRYVSHEGLETKRMSIGPVEAETVVVIDVDEEGLARHEEVFDEEQLGDAIACLYERHAGLQSEGPERDRATMTARSVRSMLKPFAVGPDFPTNPEFEQVDHRILGTWGARGSEAVREHLHALHDVAEDAAVRDDDVLGLEPAALLVHRTHFGTERVGGGTYETPHLMLMGFGRNGRLARVEFFDVAQEAEALARFEELVGLDRPPLPRGDYRGVEPPPGPLLVKEGEAFVNAASRIPGEIARAMATGDWEIFKAAHDALHSPTHQYDDRRKLMRIKTTGQTSIEGLRVLFDVPGSRLITTLLATRGERLALTRLTFEGNVDAGGGNLAIDYLALGEVDEQGRYETESVIFDPDDLDAAYAELDRRYGEGEGRHDATWSPTLRLPAALYRRDLEACRAMFAPGFCVEDHRKLGWGKTLRDAETFLRSQLAMDELSPDWRYRIDHQRARGRVSIAQLAQVGTREGGAFENPFLIVGAYDEQGLLLGLDVYDVDQIDQAQARFEELIRDEPARSNFDADALPNSVAAILSSNAAVVAMQRWARTYEKAVETGDWDAMREDFAPDMVFEDRRSLNRLSGGLDLFVDAARERAAMGARATGRLVGNAGDRICIMRALWQGGPADGPYEIEYLSVHEVDEAGRITAMLVFDVEDDRAARREAWRRWAVIEPALAGNLEMAAAAEDACNGQDWARLRALYADDLVVVDHRRTGMGRLESADQYVESVKAVWELSATTRLELGRFSLASRPSVQLLTVRRSGEVKDGGRFESDYLALAVNPQGVGHRLEMFELDDVGRALARFEKLSARTDGSSHAIVGRHERVPVSSFENDASKAFRAAAAIWAGDGPDRSLDAFAPGFRCRDRRRLVQLDLSLDDFVQFNQSLLEMKSRNMVLELMGTAGESLALIRNTVEVEDGDVGASTMESVSLIEIDDHGKLSMQTRFDPEDDEAAFELLNQRWLEIEDDRAPAVASFTRGFRDALERRDWDALVDLFAPDFIGEDHRLVSWGTLRGPRAFLESVRQMIELAPDARMRAEHMRTSHRGALSSSTWIGTRDGGTFESPFLSVGEINAEGKALRIDFYDPQHLDRALARFAELDGSALDRLPLPRPVLSNVEGGDRRGGAQPGVEAPPGPLLGKEGEPAIPLGPPLKKGEGGHRFANAASRARERLIASWRDHDWTGLTEMLPEGLRLQGQRDGVDVDLDREQYVELLRSLGDLESTGIELELLATRGDRLALHRNCLHLAANDDGPSEMENLTLTEVDERGQPVAMIRFDVTELELAYAELDERYEVGERGATRQPPELRIPPNSATRALDRIAKIIASGDTSALRELVSDDFRFDDRQKRSLVDGGFGEWMRVLHFLFTEAGAKIVPELVATAGDRLALYYDRLHETRSETRFELENFRLVEVDAAGKLRALILFDPEDRVAASEDLYARYAPANERRAEVVEFRRAWNAHDIERMRELLPSDFYLHDHRRTGVGRLDGAEAYLESLAAMYEISRNLRSEMLYFVSTAAHGSVWVARWSGTNLEGGEFEAVYAIIGLLRNGRPQGMEIFELDDLDRALARFEELAAERTQSTSSLGASEPSENAATRCIEELFGLWADSDFAEIRKRAAPDFRYEDRSRRALVEGDIDTWITSMQFWPAGTEAEGDVIATVGQRISLDHARWKSPAGHDSFEIDRIRLLEVDEQGRPRAAIHFDLDDRKAAFVEANTRFAHGEASSSPGQMVLASSFRALVSKDWKAFREFLAPDFVHCDHRTLGLGSLDPDTWIESLQALSDLTPELTFEPIRSLAWNRHGDLRLGRQVGTVEGGGPFENLLVVLQMTDGERICRVEIFDAAAADKAVTHFEKLCEEREKE